VENAQSMKTANWYPYKGKSRNFGTNMFERFTSNGHGFTSMNIYVGAAQLISGYIKSRRRLQIMQLKNCGIFARETKHTTRE
jgi:hypothetical protein